MVTDESGLQQVIDHLRTHDVIAFDTEFIGEETYYPRLCLVQVGTRSQVFLVDPFAVPDLSPLFEVIASPDRTTLVHAGRQDLQILTRAIGTPPSRVIDTQLLAGLAGLPWPCSLTKSVQHIIDAPMPPGMTFTAWDARPLSARQQRYAADDVRYLPLLYDALRAEVTARGHDQWAAAACAPFEDPAWHLNDLASQQRKIQGNRHFRPAELRVLSALVQARDDIARQCDLPPRATMPDAAVLALVRSRITTPADMAALKGMPKQIALQHGPTLLDTMAAARASDAPTPPRAKREESPEHRMAIDGLWHAYAAAAIGRGVAPAMALSRAELAEWFLNGREGMPGRADWQRDIVRSVLQPLLEDGAVLSLAWRHQRLQRVVETP